MAKTIIKGFVRGYATSADRSRAVKNMFRRTNGRVNYFVCFRDTQAEFALQFSHADWVESGRFYLLR